MFSSRYAITNTLSCRLYIADRKVFQEVEMSCLQFITIKILLHLKRVLFKIHAKNPFSATREFVFFYLCILHPCGNHTSTLHIGRSIGRSVEMQGSHGCSRYRAEKKRELQRSGMLISLTQHPRTLLLLKPLIRFHAAPAGAAKASIFLYLVVLIMTCNQPLMCNIVGVSL